jgi:non-canonical (house-cleaning) NTP pyrophosphatase
MRPSLEIGEVHPEGDVVRALRDSNVVFGPDPEVLLELQKGAHESPTVSALERIAERRDEVGAVGKLRQNRIV